MRLYSVKGYCLLVLFFLVSVFLVAASLYVTYAQPSGKNLCQGIPLNGSCDMGYWSGICGYAFDKPGISGHEICIPWCNASSITLPENVEIAPNSVPGVYIGDTVPVVCVNGTVPAPGSIMYVTCVNGTYTEFCGECLTPCPNPPGISFPNMNLITTIVGVDFIAGDILEFECTTDSVATGCNYAVCLDNGTWDVTDNGGCVATCPNPPGVSFDNMVLTTPIAGETFTTGDILIFECIAGYSSTDCNYAECLANGSWAKVDNGGCSEDCGVLDPTTIDANAVILASGGNGHGDVAILDCADPYVASGSFGAQCVNGTWESRGDEECLMTCPNPPGINFPNMQLTTTIAGVDFTAGDVLEFECDANYSAAGCNYAVCLANGTWDVTDNGGCLPNCPNPPGVSIDNMDLITPTDGETFTEGDILFFECSLSNYSASGCNYAECLANGSWVVYDNGGCSPNCPFPAPGYQSVEGAISGPDVTDDIATYACDPAISINDEAIYECTTAGWIEVQPCGSVQDLCSVTLLDLLPSDLNKCRYYDGSCYCPKESDTTYADAKSYCDSLSSIPGVDATMVIINDFAEYSWVWLYADVVIPGNEEWWNSLKTDASGTPYNDYDQFNPPPYTGHLTSGPYGADLCGYFVTDTQTGQISDPWLFASCTLSSGKKKSICEINDPY